MEKGTEIIQEIKCSFSKEDAYKTLEITNDWISNIDAKVSFALALSGTLIGFVFSTGLPNIFKTIGEVSQLKELGGGIIVGSLIVSSLYTINLISILCFLLAIIARVKNPSNIESVFFFGSIAKMELQDYKVKINKIGKQEIVEDLQEQIYINSLICDKKVRYYNIGIKFLIITIILWFICMIFRLV